MYLINYQSLIKLILKFLIFLFILLICRVKSVNYKYRTTDKYIFYLETGTIFRSTANTRCKNLHGTELASITSSNENNEITNGLGTANAWIGLYSDGNNLLWEDGESYSYSNWDGNEPSPSFLDFYNLDCTTIESSTGVWNTKFCSSQRSFGYICNNPS